MKYLSLLLILSFWSCKTPQISLEKPISQQKMRQSKSFKIIEKTEILPHQTIKIFKDESGLRYVKTLKGKNTLIKYTYKSTPIDQHNMDAGYTQYTWFEIQGALQTKTYKTPDLQKKPLYVQVLAFRNNQLFQITKDSVSIKVSNIGLIRIHFTINSQYQPIQQKNILQTLKLE